MTKKIEEPKDLGIKIGSKEEAAWTQLRDKIEEDIIQNKITQEINTVIFELAEKKIELEKEKFKKD